MFFDSALYVWFVFIVFFVFWGLVRWPALRLLWLLAASYFFYASWNVQLLSLIVASTVLDFFVGRGIHRSERPGVRRALLITSLVGNLGLLAVFKYANFFLASLQSASDALGAGQTLPVLDLVLPVGISFYTFQTLSYTIDIYRGKLEPVDSILKFALFVSFFPQLVAGPIVRASDFLPQLEQDPRYDPEQHGRGLFMILVGLTKKVVIADYLAINLVDRVFENPALYSGLETLIGVYAYAVQIYCDFSGYSDVAIGTALLLGFRLPDNFDRPYIAVTLQDFWRRWHISLSSWLRDYLYIPLGGSRGAAWRTYLNLLLTMLLGGLWHGASWNFVIWGALHGGVLAIARWYQRWRDRRNPGRRSSRLETFFWQMVTFHFVCFCWVFFRSIDLQTALAVLSSIATLSTYAPNISALIALAVFGSLIAHYLPKALMERLSDAFTAAHPATQAVVMCASAIALQQIKGLDIVPFIYFQF